MSTRPTSLFRIRWIVWRPTLRMSANSAESEPTKPSKPGFVGVPSARFLNIRLQSDYKRSSGVWPRYASAHGIQFDLDSATKSTRLMSCGANSGQGRRDCAPLLVNG